MKKYILAVVLVLASTSAMADREVSGTSTSTNKASACQEAKYEINRKMHDDEQVESSFKCECEENNSRNFKQWDCSVTAKLEKKH